MLHFWLIAQLVPSLLFPSSLAFTVLPPITNLPIINKVIAPDGFPRSTVLADGVFPGPLIAAMKGSQFSINVQNKLNDSTMNQTTTIHWHGIDQSKGSNWADGPAFVNQCPIASGSSFLYEFTCPSQAGTFWYHSHESLQYCDGLRGPLVIYDPNDPHKHLYDIDDESTVLTLADWYHTPSLKTPIPFEAYSTLVNGKGRYPGGPKVDLAVVNVQHGRRYRFRLVSISCEPNYIFSIDGHSMNIIEVDGNNVEALEHVSSLQILVGQRYSFVLHANQPVNNYWIRAQPSENIDNTFTDGQNSAILRYWGAQIEEPSRNYTTLGEPLNEVDLHALENPAAPSNQHGEADIKINLAFNIDPVALLFSVNNVSFRPPPVPVLLQLLSGAKTAAEIAPKGSVYVLPRNKVVEITMPGANVAAFGGPHPLHLHGHAFSVIRSAGSNTTNVKNPVRRDVVSIGGDNDNVTIRFTTDNPGPWFLHCHIDVHLQLGFAVVFVEDPADVPALDPPPQAWRDLCPVYNTLKDDQL